MQPKLISLFSGAGGLDYGFHAADFMTAVATDYDKDACQTLRQNNFSCVIEGDVHEITSEALLSQANLQVGEADVLIGGPPCQPFSKSSYWTKGDSKRLNDPRAKTLDAYMRVLEETQPKAFVLENVEGLNYSGKDEGLHFLLDKVKEINSRAGTNYQPRCRVLKAVDYGVPQTRARFFMVAGREGQEFHFPDPQHFPPDDPLEREPYRTAWDALADITPDPKENLAMRGKWAELLPSIPEGENYLYHTPRGEGLPLFGWRTRYWSFLLKLAKARPSWTIQAQPGPSIGPFHWDNRRLSCRELCRLQTFPDSVKISGGRTSIQRQLGNAVPSLLAEVLARAIRTQILDLPEIDGAYHLKPKKRDVVPEPVAVESVPEKFLHLRGEHKPHPGTGKGRQAIRKESDQLRLAFVEA